MGSNELLNIETYVLKVHLNCQGCRSKVKKLLRKIQGVYAVKIDAEGERVMVSGTVDPNTLVNKLLRSGKHAELVWSPSSIQGQDFLPPMSIKDSNMNMNRNQLLQQYLMSPHDHHLSGSLNLSPSLPFGSELAGQGEAVVQNLTRPLPVGGDGYDYGSGRGYRFPDLSSQYGYGDHHQSPISMTMPMPMVMNNRYYNNPLQSPPMMYGDIHMMHQPYAADYKSSLVSPYAHHSFPIPAPPYTYY